MLHVTQGLNTEGGTVSQGLNSSSEGVVLPPELVPTVGSWYVRESNDAPLFGPLSFRDADRHARYLSASEDGLGLAQLITFLGNRPGDPITFPARLFVDSYYARGKRFLGGRAAQFHSDNDLLKSAADFGLRLYGFRNPSS